MSKQTGNRGKYFFKKNRKNKDLNLQNGDYWKKKFRSVGKSSKSVQKQFIESLVSDSSDYTFQENIDECRLQKEILKDQDVKNVDFVSQQYARFSCLIANASYQSDLLEIYNDRKKRFLEFLKYSALEDSPNQYEQVDAEDIIIDDFRIFTMSSQVVKYLKSISQNFQGWKGLQKPFYAYVEDTIPDFEDGQYEIFYNELKIGTLNSWVPILVIKLPYHYKIVSFIDEKSRVDEMNSFFNEFCSDSVEKLSQMYAEDTENMYSAKFDKIFHEVLTTIRVYGDHPNFKTNQSIRKVISGNSDFIRN